jgi:hypothetical protein
MNPLRWIVQFVVGCRHRHLSRLFTIKNPTYRVCFRLWAGIRFARRSCAACLLTPLVAEPIRMLRADVSLGDFHL